MSIDVDIIPTAAVAISWNAIEQIVFTCQLTQACRRLLGNKPMLIEQGTNRIIDGAEVLRPTHYYYLRLEEHNTLGLGIERNTDTYTNEQEFLDDFARNLDDEKKAELTTLWNAVGVTYVVSSMGGRNREEPRLFVAFTVALAELSRGYVLIKDSQVFSLPVGCYTAEQFKHVDARFFDN